LATKIRKIKAKLLAETAFALYVTWVLPFNNAVKDGKPFFPVPTTKLSLTPFGADILDHQLQRKYLPHANSLNVTTRKAHAKEFTHIKRLKTLCEELF